MASRKQDLITRMKLRTYDVMTLVHGVSEKEAMDKVRELARKWRRKTTAELESYSKGL